MLPEFTPLEATILDYMGLGLFASAKTMARAFSIPADNDDSGVNMALEAFMKEVGSFHF